MIYRQTKKVENVRLCKEKKTSLESSCGEMQDGKDDAKREPEDKEDPAADHDQDIPRRALTRAPRGCWRAACRNPLANLDKTLLVHGASVGLRICVRDTRAGVGVVEGDAGTGFILGWKNADERGVVVLGPVLDLGASDGDAEEVGVGG